MAVQPSGPPASRGWTVWLDRVLWVGVAALFLWRCVLPNAGESGADLAALLVPTAGQPVLVVFDGSR